MIVPASIAKKSMQKAPHKSKDLKATLFNVGLGLLGLGVSFLIGRKIIQKIRQTGAERRFTTEGQQAILLKSAMNPSGASWLKWMDGTKEQAIYNVASQIKDFRKVQKEYSKLFNSSLVSDLQKELDTNEYTRFMHIINSGGIENQSVNSPSTSKPTEIIPGMDNRLAGKVILVQKNSNLYEKLNWYPFGSIKKAEKGTYISQTATGYIQKAKLGYGLTIPFVESRIVTAEGMVKSVYINAKNIKLVSKEDFNKNYKTQYKALVFHEQDFR